MKKTVLSLVLVVAMLMSCVCTVGAAGGGSSSTPSGVGTLNWFKAQFLDVNSAHNTAENVNVPVTIKVKLNSAPASSYASSLNANAGTLVDFIAELDMTNVKNLVALATPILERNNYSDGVLDNDITGQFVINADWTNVLKENSGNVLATGGMSGFKFYDENGVEVQNQTIFEENVSRVKNTDSSGNVVGIKATISVKAGTKVRDVLDLPDKITLEHTGFEVIDSGNVTGSFDVIDYDTELASIESKSYTEVAFSDGGRYVKYIFPVTPARINNYGYSGGGSYSTKKYALSYDSNGGTVFANELYEKGRVVKLYKTPVKEGYVFDGWYADAELTERIDSITIGEDVTVYASWLKERHPVPESLNGEDHFAYVIGYPDGTVRPDNNITRAEVTTIFFRLLKDEIRDANLTSVNVFDDVNDGDWHNAAISTMAKLGIVNGRFEDRFVPDANITRAEFTAICARFDDTEVEYEGDFKDIEGHWAEEYIKRASAYGWIEGYSDNTFRPDQFITRAEAMTLINRVLNRIPRSADDLLHDDMAKWSDNMDQNAWFYTAVQEATNSNKYERPNSLYKTWTEVVENRDWSEYQK